MKYGLVLDKKKDNEMNCTSCKLKSAGFFFT